MGVPVSDWSPGQARNDNKIYFPEFLIPSFPRKRESSHFNFARQTTELVFTGSRSP